jgi:hypothetical protein
VAKEYDEDTQTSIWVILDALEGIFSGFDRTTNPAELPKSLVPGNNLSPGRVASCTRFIRVRKGDAIATRLSEL